MAAGPDWKSLAGSTILLVIPMSAYCSDACLLLAPVSRVPRRVGHADAAAPGGGRIAARCMAACKNLCPLCQPCIQPVNAGLQRTPHTNFAPAAFPAPPSCPNTCFMQTLPPCCCSDLLRVGAALGGPPHLLGSGGHLCSVDHFLPVHAGHHSIHRPRLHPTLTPRPRRRVRVRVPPRQQQCVGQQ